MTPEQLAQLKVLVQRLRDRDRFVTEGPMYLMAQCREAADFLEALAASPAPATEPGVSGWQTMDSAPKDGTHILLWCGGNPVCGHFSTDTLDPEVKGSGSFVLDCDWLPEPTLWHPITPPTSPVTEPTEVKT